MIYKDLSPEDQLPEPAPNCFVIAEAGVNHNGSRDAALALVAAAARAGANAVKFQTFKAERLAAANAPKAKISNDIRSSAILLSRQFQNVAGIALRATGVVFKTVSR